MNNFEFEMEMRIIDLKGLIRELERKLAHVRCEVGENPDCSDLAALVKNLDTCQHMLTFIKDKAMQIMDKK